jgi:hypothetical protein
MLTDSIYKWQYRCPCGCCAIRVNKGTLEEYIIDMTATFGSRGFEGHIRRNPKTGLRYFSYILN